MWSVTTRPRTASPRNSRRSFDSEPGFSAHQLRWASAADSRPRSANGLPSRSWSASSPATGSRSSLRSEEHVVDCVSHRLEVGQVLVVDVEADRALAQLLLERLHQLDEGERVGVEVVDERVALVHRRGVDLEDVGEAVTDQLED